MRVIKVFGLDDGKVHFFFTRTAEAAMTKLKQKLDREHIDENAVINKTKDGKVLWMIHSGKTYSVTV